MKKLLSNLTLGGLFAVVTPIFLASCSPVEITLLLAITGKASIEPLPKETNLATAKKAIDDIMNGTDDDAKLAELSKYFEGSDLILGRIPNITLAVSIDGTTGLTLLLKGANGYKIGANNQGVSVGINLLLDIRIKTSIKSLPVGTNLATTKKAIDDIMNGTDDDAKLAELSKYFEGSDLILSNLSNFALVVSINETVGLTLELSMKYNATDKVVSNVLISTSSGALNIVSASFIYIDENANATNVMSQFNAIMNGNDNNAKLLLLKKYFSGNGLTINNINNVISIVELISDTTLNIQGINISLLGANGSSIGGNNNTGVQQESWKPKIANIEPLPGGGGSVVVILSPKEIASIKSGTIPARVSVFLYNGDIALIPYFTFRTFTPQSAPIALVDFTGQHSFIQIQSVAKVKIPTINLNSIRQMFKQTGT